MQSPIVINKLSKRYGSGTDFALKDLSLEVKAGECYGFLGANGAGKSTAIRLLLNFLHPSGGSAAIMGNDVVLETVEARRHVGYISGEVALFEKQTGKQLLDYLCALQGTKDFSYRHILEERFSVDLSKPIAELSKGNRQKISLIQSMMHEPDVLILDEPTSGLDPLMQEAFYLTIAENKKRSAAIFMSSHNLAEAQRVCERVGIIKQGRLIHEQAIAHDTNLTKPTFQVSLKSKVPESLLKEPSLFVLKKLSSTSLLIQPKDDIAKALSSLGKYDIKEFSSKPIDLEDEFLEFYGDKK